MKALLFSLMTHNDKRRLFEREYSDCFDAIYRYVRYRVPHVQDAEDLVSNIFTKALERLDQFNGANKLIAWLMGIAKHAVIDYWRSRTVVLDLDEAVLVIEAAEKTSQHIDDALFVEKILESLPPDARAIFTLHYIDDLTYAEIAEVTHKSPEAVRKWFSRLHHSLRPTLSHPLS